MHIILQFLQSSSKEVFFHVFPPLFYSHSVKFFSSSLAFSDYGKERAVLGSGSQSTDWVNFWPDTPRCKQNLLGRSMENFALGMLMFGFRDSKLEEECCTSLFKILLWTGKAERNSPTERQVVWHVAFRCLWEGRGGACGVNMPRWWLGSCLHQMPGGLLQMRAAWCKLLCIAFRKPEKRNTPNEEPFKFPTPSFL